MDTYKAIILLLLLPILGAAQTTSDVKDVQVAKKQLRIGNDTAKYFTAIVHLINSAATHRQSPTAKAVYDYVSSVVASGVTDGDKGDVLVDDAGATWTIDQNGATTGQVLRWGGTAWVPNGLNLYDIVAAGGTVAASLNEVWIDDISAGITLNLPACNTANDQVRIEFAKAGSDSYPVVIDPAGSELFSDGSSTKTLYSQGTRISCTCRKEPAHTGFWLFTNM